jgi:transcriptional regulator
VYLRSLFEEKRREVLEELIASYPLGAVAAARRHAVEVDHLPFQFYPDAGSCGALRCHVARANPLWQSLSSDEELLIVFQGPNHYISPSWSPGRERHGKVAPSWNYAVVHAHGFARPVEDREWLKAHLEDLAATHEAHRPRPWTLSEAPTEFIDQLLKHIVGIEITLTRLVGKWFVSQQRSHSDRAGVVEGLRQEPTDAATAVARMIESHAPQAVVPGRSDDVPAGSGDK